MLLTENTTHRAKTADFTPSTIDISRWDTRPPFEIMCPFYASYLYCWLMKRDFNRSSQVGLAVIRTILVILYGSIKRYEHYFPIVWSMYSSNLQHVFNITRDSFNRQGPFTVSLVFSHQGSVIIQYLLSFSHQGSVIIQPRRVVLFFSHQGSVFYI